MKSVFRSFVSRNGLPVLLFFSVWLVSACSGSGESMSSNAVSGATTIGTPEFDASEPADDAASSLAGGDQSNTTTNELQNDSTNTNGSAEPTAESTTTDTIHTRVEFRITVPAYQSDALQVQLEWGNETLNGIWSGDESWVVLGDFPVDTQHRLRISFNDLNGEITLGLFEMDYKTEFADSDIVEVSADQFNTAEWDDDNDGVSNLDELKQGGNPQGNDAIGSVQASIELLPIKTFRISWNTTPNAQYYRVLENPDGLSGYTDISGKLEATTTNFDHYVALYTRFNARYMVQACADQTCSDSEPVLVTGTLDDAVGYFKGSNMNPYESWFGWSVSLSENGTTMAIGAPRDSSVFVFVRQDGTWQQQSHLSGRRGNFGNAVSLSADGNTMAVGAYTDGSAATGINGDSNDTSAKWSGAVYVFVRSGESWQQQAYVKASNTGTQENYGGDFFGRSVSVSADGNTLAVGADYEQSAATGINGDQTNNSVWGAGAAYVFARVGSLWSQEAYLKASNTEQFDHFGRTVNLSADGNTLAVGAPREDSAATGVNGDQFDNAAENSGAVYIFIRRNALWKQQAYVKASNTSAGDSFGGDAFSDNVVVSGDGISLNADGKVLAVGAHLAAGVATDSNGNPDNNAAVSFGGAVYIFVQRDGLWKQEAYITASNLGEGDKFGRAVNLSSDGALLAVGATSEDGNATGINGNQNSDTTGHMDTGAVYVYANNDGHWQHRVYIKATNPGSGDRFGDALSLSGDGNTLAIGAYIEKSAATGIDGDQTDTSARYSGAVYVY